MGDEKTIGVATDDDDDDDDVHRRQVGIDADADDGDDDDDDGDLPPYKIILIGNSGVGKTNILSVAEGVGFQQRPPTLTPEFTSIRVPHPNNSLNSSSLTAHLWDTAGQERYQAIAKSHYRRASGAILVYDVSSAKSFEALPRWLQAVRNGASPAVVLAVVANKIDLLPPLKKQGRSSNGSNGGRQNPLNYVPETNAREFCAREGLSYVRVTAKKDGDAVRRWGGVAIEDCITEVVHAVHKQNSAERRRARERLKRRGRSSERAEDHDIASIVDVMANQHALQMTNTCC